MMAQYGSRDGRSLTRAGFRVGVVIALCGLVAACNSDPCPGDQIMVDGRCTPAAVATEHAQDRSDLQVTEAADDEREEEHQRESEQDDRIGSPLASPSPPRR